MAETKARPCCYCLQPIHPRAKVCHHCSRSQTRIANFIKLPEIISIFFLMLSIWQFMEAKKAVSEAQQALTEAKEARREVVGLARSVVAIGEIISRFGGAFDAGLRPEDKPLLKKEVDSLKNKIKKFSDE
jgi:hypothetical protein